MATNSKKRKPKKIAPKLKPRLVPAFILAACMVVFGVFAFRTLAATKPGQSWIVSTTALGLLQSAGASQSFTNSYFNNSGTYVVGASKNQNPIPNAAPTQTFYSYATFASKIASNSLIPGVKAVLYDNEAWSFTPSDEQHDPVGYSQKFATLAHQHGLQLIAAPAVDLASVLAPKSKVNRYQTFINLGIIGGIAKYADVTEMQAQGAENTAEYATFVQAGAQQAHDSNPNSKVFAGIGTAQSGNQFPASVLYNAFQSTKEYVSGYWLNVPQPHSSFCPGCPAGSSEVVISFLKMIGINPTPTPTPPTPKPPTPTPPPPPHSVTGPITGIAGKCVDNQAHRMLNGNMIELFTCNQTIAQTWQVDTSGAATPIVNNNGYCLDVKGAGTAPGTIVQLYQCNATVAQQWVVNASSHTILNPHSGLCLDDKGANTTDRNQIQIYTCNGTAAQKWTAS